MQSSSVLLNQNIESPSAITGLYLINFRNYADLRLQLDGRPVILTGVNGAGKTNILEAVSLLAPGRGLRGAKMGDFALAGPTQLPWSVVTDIQTPHTTHRIGTGSDPGARGKRLIQIDGKPAGQTDLAEYATIAWVTPAMDRLFVESRSERRRFLDRLVYALHPNHLQQIQILEKAQRERIRLLKFGRIDTAWIGTLEQQMAEASVAISGYRADYIDRLNSHIEAFSTDFPKLRIALKSSVYKDIAKDGKESATAYLQERLLAARERDRLVGNTGEGAGRDDFGAFHLGKGRDAADCSTGEQKMTVLAIILAHSRLLREERGKSPILLLDELAAHLDVKHRAALAAVLSDLGVQAWLSGADAGLFQDWQKQAQFLRVEKGQIFPVTYS